MSVKLPVLVHALNTGIEYSFLVLILPIEEHPDYSWHPINVRQYQSMDLNIPNVI